MAHPVKETGLTLGEFQAFQPLFDDPVSGPSKPCQGPMCRKAPDAPTPHIPLENRPPVPDEWTMGERADLSDFSPRPWALPKDACRFASERPHRLDRPPEL